MPIYVFPPRPNVLDPVTRFAHLGDKLQFIATHSTADLDALEVIVDGILRRLLRDVQQRDAS